MISRNRWTMMAVASVMWAGVVLGATEQPETQVPSPAEPAVTPTLATDKVDYQPGETAIITGAGFHANETVSVRVVHADGTSEDGHGHEPFTVTTGADGRFSTTWLVDPDDSLGALFRLTADCPDMLHAEMHFTDTSTTFVRNLVDSGNYDHTGRRGGSYIAGNAAGSSFRDWFIFSLAGISGTVTSARIVAQNPKAEGPPQTYSMFDVLTPLAELRASSTGRTDIYDDLGSGVIYGSALVSDPTAKPLTFFFDAQGIAGIQSHLGGNIAIGGQYSASGSTNYILGLSSGLPGSSNVQLIVDVLQHSPTNLSVQPATGTYGGTTTLQATLTSSGTPVAGRSVNFVLNGSNVGSATTSASGVATLDNVSLTGLDAGTYDGGVGAEFTGDATFWSSNGSATLTVSQAATTINAAGGTFPYDGNPHSATGSVTGVLGESFGQPVFTYTDGNHVTTSNPPVDAGTYKINASFGGNQNYVSGSNDSAQIVIAAAPLTVRADDKSKTYGAANPAFTASYSDFVAGQNQSVLGGTLTFTTAATTASGVGAYAMTPGGLTSNNYAITFADGTLTVNPAPLTITADDETKLLGAPVPALTASYDGFVNADTPASLDAPVTLSTTATDGSPVGTYAIAAGGAADPNYTIQFVSGMLKVVYRVCILYDVTKLHKSGSTIPVKVQLCDVSGANVSSSSVMLYAAGVMLISTSAEGEVQEPGEANPDDNFRLVGPPVSYMFNLQTSGLTGGTYHLTFTAAGDPTVYAVPFKLR